ncbi:DUF4157 domain-containing protein [Variovorax sp. J22R115]|uniref:eCIS core domain-containing protein n=1 Tax=Variovorax sp. J22R115 TaxID=3053509 RepID=UPI0025752454|nr:DUF4157 domain-containing protein [Variovorax sp. J22R115]
MRDGCFGGKAVSAASEGGQGRHASPGLPLAQDVRGFFEPRLRSDFGGVRVHHDGPADIRARRMGVVAFTNGRHIHFAAGHYQPWTTVGRWVLAHELAHVIQQGQSEPSPHNDRPSDDDHAAEHQAHQAAAAIALGRVAPVVRADGRGARPLALTEAAFRVGLGTTPEQAAAIDALFGNVEFSALWTYLRTCTATPTQDLGPLALAVTPGLTIGGTVRFGGYSGASRTLEINPTKPEHVSNPSELVDTVIHELIHAVFDLQGACTASGSGPAPLGGAATINPPTRAALAALAGGTGAALDDALTHAVGPGASDPCGEFLDENAAAQQIIARVIQANIAVTHVGHPTLTFVNLIIRGNPAALSFYKACRSTACAVAPGPGRVTAITDCSQRTIANFIPPAMTPALLPARVDFDTNSRALRADARETLHLIALFLASHPGTTVNLTGRTDASGAIAANLALSRARAEAVKVFLLSEGVPAAQLGSVTSIGASGATHRGRAGFAERSVEIAP